MNLKVIKQNEEIKSLKEEIYNLIGDQLLKVEKGIEERLKSRYLPIAEMGKYIASSPGKRLRPTLLLLTSKLINYNGEDSIEYAIALEFIHNATLIHDDIVDQALLRRGKASLNAKWGNQLSVLMGDYLYISAVDMIAKLGFNEAQPVVAETSKNLIEGELLQNYRNYDLSINEEEYFEIVKLKTAKLFSTCTVIPPILAQKDKETKSRLFNFGLFLGISFQIVDDCLDFLSDEETLGKPVGHDLKEGKITLPLIYMKERGNLEDKEFLEAVVMGRNFDKETMLELSDRLQKRGFIDSALEKAREFTEEAKRVLEPFEKSKVKEILLKVPNWILSRSF